MWGSGLRKEGTTALPRTALPACPTPGPQESQEKSATGGCGCRGSGMCPWPSRPSKPATRRDSGGTSSARRPSWVSLTTPISSAWKASSRVVGARGRRPHPAGPLRPRTGLGVHPHTTRSVRPQLTSSDDPVRKGPSAWDPGGALGSPGPQCWPSSWGGTSPGLWSAALIPPPAASISRPFPRPPGNDRDRVHGERLSGRLPEGACPHLSHALGEGRSAWVLGNNVRPPNTPETWTQQPWGRESQLQCYDQPVTLPFNPIT